MRKAEFQIEVTEQIALEAWTGKKAMYYEIRRSIKMGYGSQAYLGYFAELWCLRVVASKVFASLSETMAAITRVRSGMRTNIMPRLSISNISNDISRSWFFPAHLHTIYHRYYYRTLRFTET